MSIIVKGMEMPTSCHVCVAGYGGCCYVAPADADGICPDIGRADFCPLVPVPPHGRLIDADALIEQKEWAFDGVGQTEMVNVCEIINAPTVLEAEGKDDG